MLQATGYRFQIIGAHESAGGCVVAWGYTTLRRKPAHLVGWRARRRRAYAPCPPAEPLRALVARFSHYLGRDIRLTVMPRWAMRGLGLLIPMIREINEMLYQWDEPFVIDDRRFRDAFAAGPIAVDRAAADTVEWAKLHYRPAQTGR